MLTTIIGNGEATYLTDCPTVMLHHQSVIFKNYLMWEEPCITTTQFFDFQGT